MGYAEQRGKLWRARWKLPSGKLDGMSGFPTRRSAENYANDQEAKIRAGNYIDPRAGQMLVNTWIDTWFQSLDLELSTMENYRYLLETCVRPFFVERTLASLTTEEIGAWERDLVAVYGYSRSTAKGARARLCSALAAAVPTRISRNPAQRPHATGKRASRRIQRVLESRRTYATPLEVLLVGERLGLLAGQAAFVQWVFHGWTGARWSEGVGFDPECYHGDTVDLDWKLYELNGRFYRGRPKDGSIRTADLPPFLRLLLDRHLEDEPPRRCLCHQNAPAPYCNGRKYVFLGPDGGHIRRSAWSRRFLRPAADGAYPAQPKAGIPAIPVMASLAAGWPGIPLPKGRPGEGGVFEVPAFRGFQSRGERASGVNSRSKRADLIAYALARGAAREEVERLTREQLLDRYLRGAYVAQNAPVVSWRPIMEGLVTHEGRHGMETWMSEDGVPAVLRDDRMGHLGAGHVRERYEHVTDPMRERLLERLQQRWEQALADRVALEQHWDRVPGVPGSALPLLEELLRPYRAPEVTRMGQRLRLRQRPKPMPARRLAGA